jgi:hypothetical protein
MLPASGPSVLALMPFCLNVCGFFCRASLAHLTFPGCNIRARIGNRLLNILTMLLNRQEHAVVNLLKKPIAMVKGYWWIFKTYASL